MTTNSSTKGQPVLLDTNFLLMPFQRRIDIFEEIPKLLRSNVSFFILPQVLEELQWLVTQGGAREARAAQSAIEVLDRYASVVTDVSPEINKLDADNALLEYAKQISAIVATNDRELRFKLVTHGARVIYLRKLAVLAITE